MDHIISLDNLARDFRHAIRGFRHDLRFAVVAIFAQMTGAAMTQCALLLSLKMFANDALTSALAERGTEAKT